MIKGKDGKWYSTKAKMLEANPEPKVEDVIGKKLVTEGTITEEQRQEIENLPTEKTNNNKPFQKRMQQVESIIKMKEQQKTEQEIATKLWIAKSYVEEVIGKGYEAMETELKAQYNISKEVIPLPQDEPEIPKPKKEKQQKVIKQAKEGSKKEQYRNAIARIVKDAGKPITVEEISEKVTLLLNSDRKSWGTPISDAKVSGLIFYDKETKLYSVA